MNVVLRNLADELHDINPHGYPDRHAGSCPDCLELAGHLVDRLAAGGFDIVRRDRPIHVDLSDASEDGGSE